MSDRKLSLTFRLLRAIGMNYSEKEYGQVGFRTVVCKFFINIYHSMLLSMMNWWILEPIQPRMLRPFLVRRLGAKVGKGVFIGDHVWIDMNHANMIEIGDDSHITGGCRLLCHQRDLTTYRKGDNAAFLKYNQEPIHIGKGVMIGMETMIMPGVTIGDGAIIGAYSLVTKDILPYTVAVGRPAVVVREIPEREE